MELVVLLVDDEKEFVETFAERLQIRGFVTHVAHNGEEALRIVENRAIRLMVLDIKMPGMDGFEVLRRVKAFRPEVEVVILSGHGSDRDRELALSSGAFDYLKKPIDIDSIVRILQRAHMAQKAEVG